MAEKEKTISKFNQTGLCKFGTLCNKKHEDKVCENLNDCSEDGCKERRDTPQSVGTSQKMKTAGSKKTVPTCTNQKKITRIS